jgi:hypothetical protein
MVILTEILILYAAVAGIAKQYINNSIAIIKIK